MVRADGVHQHLRRTDLGGDPVHDAPGRGRFGRVGRLTPDAVRQLLQPLLAPVDPDHCEPGGRQLLSRRTAELTPRAAHDRHTLAHTATSVGTARKGRGVALTSVRPGRSDERLFYRERGGEPAARRAARNRRPRRPSSTATPWSTRY